MPRQPTTTSLYRRDILSYASIEDDDFDIEAIKRLGTSHQYNASAHSSLSSTNAAGRNQTSQSALRSSLSQAQFGAALAAEANSHASSGSQRRVASSQPQAQHHRPLFSSIEPQVHTMHFGTSSRFAPHTLGNSSPDTQYDTVAAEVTHRRPPTVKWSKPSRDQANLHQYLEMRQQSSNAGPALYNIDYAPLQPKARRVVFPRAPRFDEITYAGPNLTGSMSTASLHSSHTHNDVLRPNYNQTEQRAPTFSFASKRHVESSAHDAPRYDQSTLSPMSYVPRTTFLSNHKRLAKPWSFSTKPRFGSPAEFISAEHSKGQSSSSPGAGCYDFKADTVEWRAKNQRERPPVDGWVP